MSYIRPRQHENVESAQHTILVHEWIYLFNFSIEQIEQFFSDLNANHTELLDKCFLTGTIMDYHNVSQGKTTIPGVDDGEECELMDVRDY